MTTLFPAHAPPGGEVVMTWLEVGGIPVRPKRKANDPTPQRVVTRIPLNNSDKLTDAALYRVHEFADDYTDAEDAARWTERRMLALAPPYTGQAKVTLDSGLIVQADHCIPTRRYTWEYYSDTIERFVAEYRVDFRIVAV